MDPAVIKDLEQRAQADTAPAPEAANDSAPRADQPAPGVAVVVATPAQEWAGAIEMAIGMLSLPYPGLRDVWTHDVVAAVADAAVPVGKKHGLNGFGDFLNRYPEVILLATAGPVLVASMQVVKAKHAKHMPPAAKAVEGAAVVETGLDNPASGAAAPAPASNGAGSGDGTLAVTVKAV